MDFIQNRGTSLLNADEASAIETAVRTAVMSILKVFCDLSEKKSHCYEAKLAEAERENAALRFQLKATEQELQTLRQISSNYKISAEVTFSTDVEERVQEPASFQSVSSESDRVLVLKEEEEPFYESQLFIKSEMTEEYSAVNFENAQIQTYGTHNDDDNNNNHHSVNQDPVFTGFERRRLTRYENVRRYRERIRADPAKYLAWKEKNHLRYCMSSSKVGVCSGIKHSMLCCSRKIINDR
ncbi:uncharacterized protein LOC128599513 isoform X3 [Ictalurus furcatus]|uniref:uncharacterized protein LOC128599513 isoform X3 n=1 Tax=Ictalurus furcatus TaxID=66913 RepID=UPI00234FF236|nr:uncharacterized protein LOC128599513 isoform X3 [Ictalurus furcatus]XP_053467150.1 uncharacterized protein LOC128599513 isoform X3 [Ictalurus furcatus]XP_053467151.1 uncharacterized protein LOC128599513 isoform X3 [Ictalurus furcatus]